MIHAARQAGITQQVLDAIPLPNLAQRFLVRRSDIRAYGELHNAAYARVSSTYAPPAAASYYALPTLLHSHTGAPLRVDHIPFCRFEHTARAALRERYATLDGYMIGLAAAFCNAQVLLLASLRMLANRIVGVSLPWCVLDTRAL
jgi:hypothetical protein